MTTTHDAAGLPARFLAGFIAGFLATLIFHQAALALLWVAGVAPFPPFPMKATWPFGVPAVFSLAFWGGVWGIGFALVDRHFPSRAWYWVAALLFGGLLPSLVARLVVYPLKGIAMENGWPPDLLLTAFLINAAWGLGTALFLKLLRR